MYLINVFLPAVDVKCARFQESLEYLFFWDLNQMLINLKLNDDIFILKSLRKYIRNQNNDHVIILLFKFALCLL